jgi:hypothetical protein
MIITFKSGKVIANQYETVVRLEGEHRVTMQAQNDAISLIGAANVIAANGLETKWSIKLDSKEQLEELAREIGTQVQ